MKRLRYHIAARIYKVFPRRFCWADLASWQMGGQPFFYLFRHWGKPTGCIIDSKVSDTKDCYCGSWYNGKHCTSKEGREMLEEMNVERETEELITNEPPF